MVRDIKKKIGKVIKLINFENNLKRGRFLLMCYSLSRCMFELLFVTKFEIEFLKFYFELEFGLGFDFILKKFRYPKFDIEKIRNIYLITIEKMFCFLFFFFK